MPAKIENQQAANENVKLERNRFHGAEFRRLIYVADIEQNHNRATVINPAYWANVSAQLQPFDRIEVRCEDGTWISELLVLEVGRSYVRVKELTHYKLTTADVAQSQDAIQTGFEVFWRGSHHRWSVKRLADNEVVHTGEPSKNDANSWVQEHLKAQV
jgi:hypothetical protein